MPNLKTFVLPVVLIVLGTLFLVNRVSFLKMPGRIAHGLIRPPISAAHPNPKKSMRLRKRTHLFAPIAGAATTAAQTLTQKIVMQPQRLVYLFRRKTPLTEQSKSWALTGGQQTILSNYSGLPEYQLFNQ